MSHSSIPPRSSRLAPLTLALLGALTCACTVGPSGGHSISYITSGSRVMLLESDSDGDRIEVTFHGRCRWIDRRIDQIHDGTHVRILERKAGTEEREIALRKTDGIYETAVRRGDRVGELDQHDLELLQRWVTVPPDRIRPAPGIGEETSRLHELENSLDPAVTRDWSTVARAHADLLFPDRAFPRLVGLARGDHVRPEDVEGLFGMISAAADNRLTPQQKKALFTTLAERPDLAGRGIALAISTIETLPFGDRLELALALTRHAAFTQDHVTMLLDRCGDFPIGDRGALLRVLLPRGDSLAAKHWIRVANESAPYGERADLMLHAIDCLDDTPATRRALLDAVESLPFVARQRVLVRLLDLEWTTGSTERLLATALETLPYASRAETARIILDRFPSQDVLVEILDRIDLLPLIDRAEMLERIADRENLARKLQLRLVTVTIESAPLARRADILMRLIENPAADHITRRAVFNARTRLGSVGRERVEETLFEFTAPADEADGDGPR